MKNRLLILADLTGILPTRGTTAALNLAGASSLTAAAASRAWENGGDEALVADTAAAARAAASIALEAVVSDEPWEGDRQDPDTRRARLAYAAWLVLLAGSDEDGECCDLETAARLFFGAAAA